MASTLDTCGDGCGWIAGIVAALAYGSFGVPVRHTKHIPVHPLVLQTFKTVTMFVLSWGVLFLGVTPSWTPLGLVSGFLWVAGGTGGVYAIRMAGLAIAVGTWASVMILVNFIWGILVFAEPIHDIIGTLAAFVLLTLGLVGMSVYAAPQAQESNHPHQKQQQQQQLDPAATETTEPVDSSLNQMNSRDGEIVENDSDYRNMDSECAVPDDSQEPYYSDKNIVVPWLGIQLTQRQAGIAGAVFNGVMTGSSLIPLHYAKAQGYGGANYMLSMAGGALIANTLLWIIFYFYQCYRVMVVWPMDYLAEPAVSHFTESVSSLTDDLPDYNNSSQQPLWRRAYYSMPKWHFQALTVPGIGAGVLLSIAMFGSILSVTYLGQGVGNSIVQTKILISGLWGIGWFHEIRGCPVITKWLASACLTVCGIVWLSHERILATRGGGGGH